MSHAKRQAAMLLAGILLLGLGVWWWLTNMEQRWTARIELSEAAREDPMLAASRLLAKHNHPVRSVDTLAQAERTALPDGTLVMLDNTGIMTPEQAARLLAWVERGNTLIMRPGWDGRLTKAACDEPGSDGLPEGSRDAADTSADPIGKAFGITLKMRERPQRSAVDSRPCFASLRIPGAGHTPHSLQLDADGFSLHTDMAKASPLFGSDGASAVRVYARGAGHVAFLSQNYFGNAQLEWYDHAGLLLALVNLRPEARDVIFIRHLDMPRWPTALWWHFKQGIIGTACFLGLLFWLALRRFGPVLPEPTRERRSLIEHIDASGRWLWEVPGGRDLLLTGVRHNVVHLLGRRKPELPAMPPAARAQEIARDTGLPYAEITAALFEPASRMPAGFTRQIQTLHLLRSHYER
jgi:hypothetical protein